MADQGLTFLLKQSPALEVLDINHCQQLTGTSIRQLSEVPARMLASSPGSFPLSARGKEPGYKATRILAINTSIPVRILDISTSIPARILAIYALII